VYYFYGRLSEIFNQKDPDTRTVGHRLDKERRRKSRKPLPVFSVNHCPFRCWDFQAVENFLRFDFMERKMAPPFPGAGVGNFQGREAFLNRAVLTAVTVKGDKGEVDLT